MAATRLIALHITKGSNLYKSLSDRLGYSENEKKTEGKRYVASYGCDVETADEEFLLSHMQYHHTMRALRTREIIAYQIRQSFKPGEITPEKANAIGYETAMRFTKGKYAFTVSTHVDKAHIHNHIIFNAISMDGKKKFRNFYFSGIALRRLSDIICFENGLSVIEPGRKADSDRLKFVKDIEAKMQAGYGKGYANWAKRFNAKQLSKTILFLQEHRISSFEELKEMTDDHIKTLQNLTDSMKEKEAYLKENKRMQKAIVDYAKNRKVFEAYKKSGYSRAFREKYQQELLTYEAAVEVYKSVPDGKMPKMKELREQYGEVLAQKKEAFQKYASFKKEVNEYLITRRNLEMIYQEEQEDKVRNSRSENVL